MAGETLLTTDHNEIKKWVEERDGIPATVKGTTAGEAPGLLRVSFPGFPGEENLEALSWEDFFKKFEEKNLAFMYQETTKDGGISRFNKFVSRKKKGGD